MRVILFLFVLSAVRVFCLDEASRKLRIFDDLYPASNPCSYYEDTMEDVFPCGTRGYALGYGKKYCNRFRYNHDFSLLGKTWRDKTMFCLQDEINVFLQGEAGQQTCSSLKDYAFDSHPPCYTSAPVSFCELKLRDYRQVLKIIDTRDLLGKRGRRQIADVARICLNEKQRLGKMGQKTSPEIIEILERLAE